MCFVIGYLVPPEKYPTSDMVSVVCACHVHTTSHKFVAVVDALKESEAGDAETAFPAAVSKAIAARAKLGAMRSAIARKEAAIFRILRLARAGVGGR